MSTDDATDGEQHDDETEHADEPLLSLSDVEVHYDMGTGIERYLSDKRVKAVDGVDLELEENDIVVLVGESGCGKTTSGKSAVGPRNGGPVAL